MNLSLNQTLLTLLAFVRQNWMTQLILAISLWAFLSFNFKGFYYSYAWFCGLCEGRFCFRTGLISKKLCKFLTEFWTGSTSLSALLLFPLLITFLWLCMVFDSISSNIVRFSWSTHPLMSLYLMTLTFIIGLTNSFWCNWYTWWTLIYFFHLKWPYSHG